MIEEFEKELNSMELSIKAISTNESFARASVAGFCLQLNPTVDELTDIKTAVSEAVTNSIVHAYPESMGEIKIKVVLYKNSLKIEIRDFGIGISNLEEATKPFYTTKPDQERSGMGFTVMESFMDKIQVENATNEGKGLKVTLFKSIKQNTQQQKIKNIN